MILSVCIPDFRIDVFSGKEYRDLVLESLRYCQQNKGMLLHGWYIMSNHIHLAVSAKHDCPDSQPQNSFLLFLESYAKDSGGYKN